MKTKIFMVMTICFLIFSISNVFSAAAYFEIEQDSDAKTYQKAHNLVLDEKWDSAISTLQNFIEKYPKSKWVDDARFWKCYAGEKKGDDLESVFECYQKFVKRHRSSKWTDDAKSNMVRLGTKLSKMGKTEYTAIVKTMQDSENEEVSLTALYALQSIGSDKALDVTIDLFDKTKSERVKEKIVYVIGSSD